MPHRSRIVAVAWCLVPGPFLSAQTQRFEEVHGMLPVAHEATLSVVLGDVDGDSDLDLILGNQGPNRLLRNEGTGGFTLDASFPGGSDASAALILADFDGDLDLDLFVGNRFGLRNRLLRNDGPLGFVDVTSTQLPFDADDTVALAAGDVDGDGDLDVLAGNRYDAHRLYLNDGTGLFLSAPATALPPYQDLTEAVALVDVDGDLDLDLIVTNFNGYHRLSLNDGSGNFVDAPMRSTEDAARTSSVLDVEGDGDQDLLVGHVAGLTLLLNDGSGTFREASRNQLPGRYPFPVNALRVVDLDGDLDLDVVLGSRSFWATVEETESGWLRNDGSGTFSLAPIATFPPSADATNAIAVGDVDGDRDLDIFLANQETLDRRRGENTLLLNDGTATFQAAERPDLPPNDASTHAMTLADVDGDGDLDLFVANDGERARLQLNDGNGTFTDVTETHLPLSLASSRAVACADVDGDGDLDVVVANFDGPNQLLRNDGVGVFTDVSSTHLPSTSNEASTSLAVGDVDGDGDLDLLFGNEGRCTLLTNGGSGVFADVTFARWPWRSAFTQAVLLVDIDLDGDLDAVLGNAPCGAACDGQDFVYLNDGRGFFHDATATFLPPDTDATRALVAFDADGDGEVDLLAANGWPGLQERLYLNVNGVRFVDATAASLPPDATESQALTILDFDSDGDLDVVVGEPWEANRWLVNDGSGRFQRMPSSFAPNDVDRTFALVTGDVDGDGDLDVLVGNDGHRHRSYRNLTHQLAWRTLPRLGKRSTLELSGSPSAPWTLAFALNTANVALGSFGTLRLDPLTLTVLTRGTSSATGRASLSFLVPMDPVLLAVPVPFQAVTGLPPRFTNLELVTLTNL